MLLLNSLHLGGHVLHLSMTRNTLATPHHILHYFWSIFSDLSFAIASPFLVPSQQPLLAFSLSFADDL